MYVSFSTPTQSLSGKEVEALVAVAEIQKMRWVEIVQLFFELGYSYFLVTSDSPSTSFSVEQMGILHYPSIGIT